MLSHSVRPSSALRTILPEEHIEDADELLTSLLHIHHARNGQPHGLVQGAARDYARAALHQTQWLERVGFECRNTPRLLKTLRDIVVLHVYGPAGSEGASALADVAGNAQSLQAELAYRGLSAAEMKDTADWTRNLPCIAQPASCAPRPAILIHQ